MTRRHSVLIADDHPIVADALAASLARWFRIVGVVTRLEEILPAIEREQPRILLLDLTFGGESSLPLIEPMRRAFPGTDIVVLTAHEEPVMADAALRAGALGYVVKRSAQSEVRVAIDEALAGKQYLTPAMQVRGAGGVTPKPAESVQLTERQRTVLGLLRQGMTHAQIALQLGIATKTVEYHVDTLGRRIGVSGKAQLIRWAEQFFRDG